MNIQNKSIYFWNNSSISTVVRESMQNDSSVISETIQFKNIAQ